MVAGVPGESGTPPGRGSLRGVGSTKHPLGLPGRRSGSRSRGRVQLDRVLPGGEGGAFGEMEILRYQRLLDMSRDAFIEIAASGVITEWNQRAEQFFGWSREEVLGRELHEFLIVPRYEAYYRRKLDELIAQGDGARPRRLVAVPAIRRDGGLATVTTTSWVCGSGPDLRVGMLIQDATEGREVEEALAHAYLHDALTGLANKSLFMYRLSYALARADGAAGTVAVLVLDVDRFKSINDARGHEVGDELLLGISKRLVSVIGNEERVARFGGDEFLVLCEGDDVDARAEQTARAISDSLGDPFILGGSEIFATVSIGIAITDSSGGDAAKLLSNADTAMYQAKQRGGNGYELFGEVMRVRVLEHMSTENSLHRALERDELRVYFQPVVDIQTTGAIGVEALIRWAHPEHGLIAPDRFIPVAEESGLIVPIGAWVLEESCRRLTEWLSGSLPLPTATMEVNLSARQVDHPQLVATVDAILARTGVAPENLTLEITESALMSNAEMALDVLKALKDLGVVLAIDDFGTGYSSLAYLRRFPLDILKIDKSFVDNIGVNESEAAIVAAVINLAHTLGLRVIAEGVETEEQLGTLQRLECDYAQGYLFSRPLPEADLADMFSSQRLKLLTP